MFSKFELLIMSLLLLGIASSCGDTNTKDGDKTSIENVVKEITQDENIDTSKQKEDVLIFKVSLGVMPDMEYQGKGLHIVNVTEGKPGFKAGIQKGDIVVKMGGDEVTDLMSYTKILMKYKEGDQAELVVKRDEKLMLMRVEF